MSKKIFLIAGEHSGDVLGGGLMAALQESGTPVEFAGIGGPMMEAQGLKSLLPMNELCVMGVLEIAAQLPRLLRLIHGVVEEIEKFQPDVVVTIDLPDFNFQVASRLKKRGKCKAKIVHYVAPSVWAWRPGRAKKVAKFLDGVLCLFPFEPQYFTKVGLKAEFTGHPLIEEDVENLDRERMRAALEIPDGAPVIGLMFGSRVREVTAHADDMVRAVNVAYEQIQDLQVIVPTLPGIEFEVREAVAALKCPVSMIMNPADKWNAFAACDMAVAVSGTVCLELAYAGVPHITVYRMNPLTWVIVKLLVKTKYANLANILAGEEAVPELLQWKFNVMNLTRALLRFLKFPAQKQAQVEKLVRIKASLQPEGGKTPSQKAAEFVLNISAN